MNELIFLIQIIVVSGFAYGAFRLGESALITWVSIQALMANLFVIKQITLFGFEVTASDAYAIGSIIGLNFLQEHFSKESAVKATYICFFFMAFFVILSQLHLTFEASPTDTSQSAFTAILSLTPRLLLASMCVFFLTQRFDIFLFTTLKKMLPTASFTIRTVISLIFSQFFDTALFTVIGLYGVVNSIIDIIVVSFAIKLCVIFCLTPIMKWIKV